MHPSSPTIDMFICELHAQLKYQRNRGFHKMHKIGNDVINANFAFSHIWSFLLYAHQMEFANVKLNISEIWRYEFQGWSLVLFISNCRAKIKLAILSFLYCRELVKTSNMCSFACSFFSPTNLDICPGPFKSRLINLASIFHCQLT